MLCSRLRYFLYIIIPSCLFFPKLHQKLSESNMDGLDSKEWKSVVLPKIYEEKMQKLEAELEKKVRTLMAPVQALGTASSYPSLKPELCPQWKVSVTLD